MKPISVAPTRATRAIAFTCAGMFALSAVVTACADKGLTRPEVAFNPKFALQLTITADQQAGFGPRFLIAAAGFDGENGDSSNNNNGNNDGDEGGFLGYKVVPFVQGTITLTVPVDLSKCLAYYAERGRKSCPLLVGAAIVEDTSFVTDTIDSDPFKGAFDTFLAGPFEIGAGGVLPRIPPINLSASRFGVVKWAPDNALQLGGAFGPTNFTTAITGLPSGPGVVLFAGTQGNDYAGQVAGQPTPGPYPQLAIFSNGIWSRVSATVIPPTTQGPTANFTAVTPLSLSEVYLAHGSGLYKYDGASIAKVAGVPDSLFSAASVTTAGGAKLVIAGSNNGGVWIGNTQTWTKYTLSLSQRIDGVCITGPSEAFASSTTGGGGGLWRFDGTAWTSVPSSPAVGKFALQCPSAGQAYVIANNTALLKWNGTTWTTISGAGLQGLTLLATWGIASANDMYASGDSASQHRAFYRFNGTSWSEVGRLRFTQGGAGVNRTLWADPRGGAAYYANGNFGRVEKVTPTGVSVVSYQPSTRDISMSSLNSAFAVGWNMMLARWDGVKWTMDTPPVGPPTAALLQGVWSDRSSNAWAVGTSSAIVRYDGTSWTAVSEFSKPIATPDAYNGVWGVGTDVWVVGNASIVHCRSATNCSTEASGGAGALYSVWGTSATNVFAVGFGGRITRFNGTTWTPMASPTSKNLVRVTGVSPTDIWAIGDSALVRFDGTSWTNVAMEDDLARQFGSTNLGSQSAFQLGLWVRSPTEVYVTGPFGDIVRFDGQEWRSMIYSNFRRRVVGISGLPSGCALALLDGQGDSPAPTLLRGIGPSGCFLSPMTPPTSWP